MKLSTLLHLENSYCHSRVPIQEYFLVFCIPLFQNSNNLPFRLTESTTNIIVLNVVVDSIKKINANISPDTLTFFEPSRNLLTMKAFMIRIYLLGLAIF